MRKGDHHRASPWAAPSDPRFVLAGCAVHDAWTVPILEAGVRPGAAVTVLAADAPGAAETVEVAAARALRDGVGSLATFAVDGGDVHACALDSIARSDVVVLVVGDPLAGVRALRSNVLVEAAYERAAAGGVLAAFGAATSLLGARFPTGRRGWDDGLAFLSRATIVAAWDPMGVGRDDLSVAAAASHERSLVLLEERAALAGDGVRWRVVGRDNVRIREGKRWSTAEPGDAVLLDLRGGAVDTLRRSA